MSVSPTSGVYSLQMNITTGQLPTPGTDLEVVSVAANLGKFNQINKRINKTEPGFIRKGLLR